MTSNYETILHNYITELKKNLEELKSTDSDISKDIDYTTKTYDEFKSKVNSDITNNFYELLDKNECETIFNDINLIDNINKLPITQNVANKNKCFMVQTNKK